MASKIKLGRRDFLARFLGGLAVPAFFRLPSWMFQVTLKPVGPSSGFGAGSVRVGNGLAARFLDEDLLYRITLFWILTAAKGRLRFTETRRRGIYMAEVEGEAEGVITWLTSHRKQKFLSKMKIINDSNGSKGTLRFVTVRFERMVIKKDLEYRSIHRFYYKRKERSYKVYRNGKLHRSRRKAIPKDVSYYDDFLSSMYNFRSGVYGPIEKGKDFVIRTLPFKGVDTYQVHICTPEEEAEEAEWKSRLPGAEYLVRVKIDQKVFGLRTGEARFWGTGDLVPLAAAVRDAVSFGSVYATLINAPAPDRGQKQS